MVEDHAQIFVDYNGNIQEFNREVMEKGLDYHKKKSCKAYSDSQETIEIRTLKRIKAAKRRKNSNAFYNEPLGMLKASQMSNYPIALNLFLPNHIPHSRRDIKGHYSRITEFLNKQEIPYECFNPPTEERKIHTKQEIRGLERRISTCIPK